MRLQLHALQSMLHDTSFGRVFTVHWIMVASVVFRATYASTNTATLIGEGSSQSGLMASFALLAFCSCRFSGSVQEGAIQFFSVLLCCLMLHKLLLHRCWAPFCVSSGLHSAWLQHTEATSSPMPFAYVQEILDTS